MVVSDITMISFSVLNLNIMHGRNRRSAVFPPRVGRGEIEQNLKKIADSIKTHNPDIVTLQEVDEVSVLSGSFNQFEFLTARLNYPHAYFAPSCSVILFGKKIFVSGNAIFSKYPLENCASYNFDFSFPTDRMGFAVADAQLPSGEVITIASVHLVYLDWMRHDSRARQLKLVEGVIRARGHRAIISGDFNCDTVGNEPSLRDFVARLELRAYEAENSEHFTHPSWQPEKRIDWILMSQNIAFTSHETLQDKVSDHLAVFARLSTS